MKSCLLLHFQARRARALLCAAAMVLAACGNDDSPPDVASAAADSFTVSWNSGSAVDVLANDTVSPGNVKLAVATLPSHGVVTDQNGTLVYTPEPGYFGADEFSYKLGGDSASSIATVSLVVLAQFALQGVVTDGPIANAQVQARVGSQTFNADADAAGRYSVQVRSSQPGDFVTLTATGVGSQSAVVLTSLVAEVAGLASQVVDGKLTAEHVPALQVTHLSAAQAGLMAQLGLTPTSNAELAAAAQQLDSHAVLDAAALVRLVVDGGVALPDGVASTRDLLQSAPALAAFHAARRIADKPQLEAAWSATLEDPALMRAPAVPAADAAPMLLRYAHGVGGSTLPVPRLTLRADGSATVVSDVSRPAHWRVEGAALRVTYDAPIVVTGLVDDARGSGEQYAAEFVSTELQFSDLGASNGRYALASMTHVGYTQTLAGPSAGRVDNVGRSLLRRHVGGAVALRSEDFPVGARIGGLQSERPPESGGPVFNRQDVLRITGSGTGLMERTGATAHWRVVEGALLVDIGTQAYRYVPLGVGVLGEARWAMEQLDAAGEVISHREIMAVRATAAGLSVSEWAKLWHGNLNASAGLQVVYGLQADGRWGVNSSNRGEPLPIVNPTRYWRQLPDGRLELVSSAGGCNPFVGVPTCRISFQRFWTPVARSGRTVWLIEHLIGNPASTTTDTQDIRFVAFTDLSPGS